jgi:hypothetical protein
MDAETLKAVFPVDDELSPVLVRLCEHSERTGENTISCDFALSDSGQEQLERYFGESELPKSFAVFGVDDSHSFYALWLLDGRKLADAPVAYLAGAGYGTGVLAKNMDDFLPLLAAGIRTLGLVDDWEEDEPCENAAALREDLGIEKPAEPRSIVDGARAEFPDLQPWIEEHRS